MRCVFNFEVLLQLQTTIKSVMMKNFVLLGAVLFLASASLSAQIITDRPDATESAATVPQLALQIETGMGVAVNEFVVAPTLNTTLLRFGLIDQIELRVVAGVDRYRFRDFDFSETGFGDMQVGLKGEIYQGERFQVAALAHVILPTGSDFNTLDAIGTTSRLSLEYDVSDRVSIGVNLGHDYLGKDVFDDPVNGFAYTAAVGFSLTDKWGYYTEIFGDKFPLTDWSVIYDHGITYLINDNLQLDATMGIGVTERSSFYSVGVSWLFDPKGKE